MRRLALYSFVITLIWLGWVVAISFLEAHAASVVENAMDRGHAEASLHHLFQPAVQRAEWICCAFSWILTWRTRRVRERVSIILLVILSALLAIQSTILLPALVDHDPSTPAIWQTAAQFISELLKASALGLLAAAQIQSFARAVISE